jgi:hypothetical protein
MNKVRWGRVFGSVFLLPTLLAVFGGIVWGAIALAEWALANHPLVATGIVLWFLLSMMAIFCYHTFEWDFD